jgi:hypothetical protein
MPLPPALSDAVPWIATVPDGTDELGVGDVTATDGLVSVTVVLNDTLMKRTNI